MSKILKIVPAEALPGWQWVNYGDGSGRLESSLGNSYFSYDLQPYSSVGGIEFQFTSKSRYDIFYGSLKNFQKYAEREIILNGYDKNDYLYKRFVKQN